METTTENLHLTSLVNQGIATYLEKTKRIVIGKYESVVESRLILNLCINQFESINLLVKKDLEFLPSAIILARSLFESALNVIWILHPSDIFECESRYLARLKEYEKWLKDQIKFYNALNWNSEKYSKEKDVISTFTTELEKLLIGKGQKVPLFPNIRDILKKINEERKYLYYRLLSSYTHGGYHSIGIYRKNLGTCKQLGVFIDINDWKLVYAVVWPVFELASELFIDRATLSNIKNIYSEEFKKEIRDCLAM